MNKVQTLCSSGVLIWWEIMSCDFWETAFRNFLPDERRVYQTGPPKFVLMRCEDCLWGHDIAPPLDIIIFSFATLEWKFSQHFNFSKHWLVLNHCGQLFIVWGNFRILATKKKWRCTNDSKGPLFLEKMGSSHHIMR
jgi:hypothetical protein